MAVVVNQDVLDMEYAVRGPIPIRAAELRKQGHTIIPCNIGNPQALGQKPITYYRQVLALLEEPDRIAREHRLRAAGVLDGTASEHVLEVAASFLERMPAGLGAYTDSHGAPFIREAVARFIDDRDGGGSPPADPDRIFLTNGASEGVRMLVEQLIAEAGDGILIPIPQYPLYSATIKRCGGTQVGYYPDEDRGWSLERETLEEAIDGARRRGIRAKAIVVINPANPTGAILEDRSVHEVIDFAERHGLVVIADEVYQENLYGAKFLSFARALGTRKVPLFSLHSTSKGFYGECGHRGGYLEARNPPKVQGTDLDMANVLFKQASVNLCSNTAGQALTYLMVSPPEPGSESHEAFVREKAQILEDLETKAARIRKAFDEMEGVRCFGRTGAMYLFPRLEKLPPGTDDFAYCMRLLEETGLCTVNGSGFGQREGTSHLRIAFLPPREVLEEMLPRWIEFHDRYVGGRSG
jgi:aspartate/methionine/tyrosine aminotransferase